MSAMPRKRRPADTTSSIAMGQKLSFRITRRECFDVKKTCTRSDING